MKNRLSEIKNRLEAATPGPWDNRCLNTLDNMAKPRHIWTEYGFICELKSPLDSSVADAEFIANAPQDIADLLAVVEVYEAGLKDVHDGIHGEHCEDDTHCNWCESLIMTLTKAQEIFSSSES